MDASSDERLSPPEGPSSSTLLRCKKCDKEFKMEYHWKRHVDKPPAYCITEQARRARRQPVHQRSSFADNGDSRLRLANLRQTYFLPDHIPKSVRRQVTSAFSEVLKDVAESNSVSAWEKLMLFSYTTLGQLRNAGEERTESLPKIIRRNLLGGNILLDHPSYVGTRSSRKAVKDSDVVKQVARKTGEHDLTGAVQTLVAAETILPATEETLQVLRDKHPARADPEVTPPDSPLAPLLTIDDVRDAVTSFRNGSAAGPDDLRPQYLKEMIADTQGRDNHALLDHLTQVSNVMFSGTVPESVRPLLFGANLFAFGKKDGGVRPIAVKFALRRLVSKIVSRRARYLGDELRPAQLGFATPRVVEVAIHAARNFLETHQFDESPKVLMKLDVRNAFNSVDRKALLEAVKLSMPGYFPFLYQAYGKSSFLLCGGEVVMSAQGLQQGDPFGPVGYCLTTAPCHEGLSSTMAVSYLDDDILGGKPDDVLGDFTTLIARSEAIGLKFNFSKCEVLVVGGNETQRLKLKQTFSSLYPELVFPTLEELSYLGAPLSQEAVLLMLEKANTSANKLMDRLKILPAHHAYHLLRICMGPTKLLHLLRCSRAYNCGESLDEFHESVRVCFSSLSNNSMNGAVWSQAVLPISMGGIGLRRASELALPAFLASAHACGGLVSQILPNFDLDLYLANSVDQWLQLSHTPAPEVLLRSSQKVWDGIVLLQSQKLLKEALVHELTSTARLKAVKTKECSAWLRALPAAPLGNLMDDSTFRICIALRRGGSVGTEHRCVCGELADHLGYHALDCATGTGKQRRHFNLNGTIARAFGTFGARTELEPTGLSLVDGKRPDGLTLEPWERGKSLAWDATCVSTLALSHLASSTAEAGAAANQAERRKLRIYEDLKPNYHFAPVGFETLGPWRREASRLLSELGRRIKMHTGQDRSMEYLRQRVSLDIQRGNAACVLGTRPQPDRLDDMFLIARAAKYRN